MRWWAVGYCDGIRRDMSSAERGQVAIKFGAYRGLRHEVGIIFDGKDKPAITFAYFADKLSHQRNYGGTHPAVQAHAMLGRAMLDLL